ncbi:MAG: type II 3-dehydroquinate dehydratase [Flavobacteriales bacterium]|jgi:3-dehydroquinate dehydratase-2
MKVIIINGPNLNLLGKREESIYGNISFEEYFDKLKANFPRLELEYYQSNIEGEIINKLHDIGFSYDCILLNAGGYTHTSVAITDAIAAISTDVIEVHMTNIYSREEFREKSLLSINCKSVICGFGLKSYSLALESL